MKKIVVIITVILITSCAKDKVSSNLVNADCSDSVKFATQVMPIITESCAECHGLTGNENPKLVDYNSISLHASSILKSVKGDGLPLMPDGGPALNDSLIQKISCWIQQGKLNN